VTTRLKTIQYAIPVLATLADNTLTPMTQITLYIPEFSGTVTFRSVILGTATATGGDDYAARPDDAREPRGRLIGG